MEFKENLLPKEKKIKFPELSEEELKNPLKNKNTTQNQQQNPSKQPKIKLDTLKEPITFSILRDLKQISKKIKLVILPFGKKHHKIKNWDLWGPLILCILLAWTLSSGTNKNEANTIFGAVFCLIWLGAGVVTLNAKLLKGNVSFFHCVCTLGYSLFPMNLSAFFCVFFKGYVSFVFFVVLTFFSFLWSCKSASKYMEGLLVEENKGICLYPVFLFYSFLFFFILQMTQG